MKNKELHVASTYAFCEDLWIITTYFNPFHFAVRLKNYRRFAENLTISNLHFITVECAFGNDAFELAPDDNVIQIRGRDLM